MIAQFTELTSIRIKPNHSETGTAWWQGRRVFFKRYLDDHGHFETEIQALQLLRDRAPASFRFVDELAHYSDSRTIVFPLLTKDASQAACEVNSMETIVEAVCNQIDVEIKSVQSITKHDITLRAHEPWHFLRRIESLISDDRNYQIVQSILARSSDYIVFRYDPQLDNFAIDDRGIWSIDFSMWRVMPVAYPFAFLWHDVVERPRHGLDGDALRDVVVRRTRDWFNATGRNPDEAVLWLLACRAEALAHEVDGHLRRGNSCIAASKLSALRLILMELQPCL